MDFHKKQKQKTYATTYLYRYYGDFLRRTCEIHRVHKLPPVTLVRSKVTKAELAF